MKVFYYICILVILQTGASAKPTSNNLRTLGDDWDDLYTLMERFLQMANGIDTQWSSLMDETVDQIGTMSDRILYTENLILDEGKQIGIMADRIVETVALMKNLSEVCANCKSSDQLQGSQIAHKRQEFDIEVLDTEIDLTKYILFEKGMFTKMKVETPEDLSLGMGPIGPIIEFMQHTMDLMQNMSGNVTQEMLFLEKQIGVMADRIVNTECLIMNMSKQIGKMADRIVQTEYLVSNMTTKCCKPLELEPKRDTKYIFVSTSSAPHCNGTTVVNQTQTGWLNYHIQRKIPRNPHPNNIPILDCFMFDPICIATKQLMKLAEKIEDTMYEMALQMLNKTTEGALEIGKMADDIVDMENIIIKMGENIGQMADMIVNIESLMLNFAQHFCHMSSQELETAKILIQARKRVLMILDEYSLNIVELHKRMGKRMNTLNNIASVGYLLQKHSDDLADEARFALADSMAALGIVNPLRWITLMKDIMSTMLSMSSNMVENMGQILDSIYQMSQRIVTTMGNMGKMAQQIVDMMGRVAKTEKMMETLVQNCGL